MCSEKAQAKGWRQWLTEDLDWQVDEENYWQDKKLAMRLAPKLERWVGLMREHGGSQAQMIEDAPEEIRDLFQKRIRLMAPLLKAWKTALKDEGAVDFPGLIQQRSPYWIKGGLLVRGSTFWSMSFRISHRSEQGCLKRYVSKTHARTCLLSEMIGRRSIVSAAQN